MSKEGGVATKKKAKLRKAVVRVFDEALAWLDKRQRERLRKHAKLGTPILCGSEERAGRYFKDGCGCPAQLATVLRVPDEDSNHFQLDAHEKQRRVLCKMLGTEAGVSYSSTRFCRALVCATADEVREAMRHA